MALLALPLSLSDSQIQAAIGKFADVFRIIPPDLLSKLRIHGEANRAIHELALSLRQTSGSQVNTEIEEALQGASTATLEDIAEIAQADGFAEMAVQLDDLASELLQEERRPEQRPSFKLTTGQQIQLALVMVVLIWFFTLGEQDSTTGEELHTISQSIVASIILWGVLRTPNAN